ncbi:MAG: flagellar basal body rod protein FlgB [Gammaproteobacteria bacterium]|nr:flagellar basal body rod protein FlgB [Gammaproteobacteria bacterium]
MTISFDRALGIHERALATRVQRAEVLANNLANADTPGFKARDIDFRAVLAQAGQSGELSMQRTHANHLPLTDGAGSVDVLYRNPLQPAIDGNTVDTQYELAQYTRNAMDYQSSFQFLNSKFKGLVSAIKGE